MPDVDNMSDHEPLYLVLELCVEVIISNVKHVPRPSSSKATNDNISAYEDMLRESLGSIDIS